jgi:hypothetical protein
MKINSMAIAGMKINSMGMKINSMAIGALEGGRCKKVYFPVDCYTTHPLK